MIETALLGAVFIDRMDGLCYNEEKHHKEDTHAA